MSFRLFLCLVWTLSLVDLVPAFVMRSQGFNATTSLAVSSFNSVPTAIASTSGRQPKIHIESSETGYEVLTASSTRHYAIQSDVAHFESSATGFDEPAPTTDAQAGWRPHLESSAVGWQAGVSGGEPVATSYAAGAPATTPKPNVAAPTIITNNGYTFTPVPATSVVIGSQALSPGGQTATIGEGGSATQIYLDGSGTPVVVVGGTTSTIRYQPSPAVIEGQTLVPDGPPITVGSGSQATTYSIDQNGQTLAFADGATTTLAAPSNAVITIGGVTATVQASEYQYLVASSTLAVGHPITVSGTILSLTTDAAGSTVLVAGDSSTTLPARVQPAQITAPAMPFDVSATVVDGTTEYIVQLQTLAPGQPITVNGTVVSIATSGSATLLVIGGKTTTLGPSSTRGVEAAATADDGPTLGTLSFAAPSATSTRSDAQSIRSWGVCVLFALFSLVAVLGLG